MGQGPRLCNKRVGFSFRIWEAGVERVSLLCKRCSLWGLGPIYSLWQHLGWAWGLILSPGPYLVTEYVDTDPKDGLKRLFGWLDYLVCRSQVKGLSDLGKPCLNP